MPNLAALIREAERVRGAVRVVGPDPEPSTAGYLREMPTPQLSPWGKYTEEAECAFPVAEKEELSVSTVRLSEEQMEFLRSSMAPPPEVMTLTEAAAYLRVGRNSVLDMVHDEGLPAAKLAGKWRFKRSALDHWLEIHLGHHPRVFRQ